MPDQSNVDVLVVAAHTPELEGLGPLLASGPTRQVGPIRGEPLCLEPIRGEPIRVAARAVGIGLCEAAAGTLAALSEHRPRAVIQIGTCGVYPQCESRSDEPSHRSSREAEPHPVATRLRIGAVAVARRVHLISAAVVLGKGVLPEVMGQCADADPALSAALAGPHATMVDVATTLAITTDALLAARIADRGCAAEHLEAFAVLHACALRTVPFAAVLAVANEVGPAAHEQWAKHHRSAGARAAEHVVEWMAAGAPGLPRRA